MGITLVVIKGDKYKSLEQSGSYPLRILAVNQEG